MRSSVRSADSSFSTDSWSLEYYGLEFGIFGFSILGFNWCESALFGSGVRDCTGRLKLIDFTGIPSGKVHPGNFQLGTTLPNKL